jgi:hypothetical protein
VQIGPTGTVTDVTAASGLPWNGPNGKNVGDGKYVDGKFMMGASFYDLNKDGLPDLVATGQHSAIMYSFMQRVGTTGFRFTPPKSFDQPNEFVGISTLRRSRFNFPCGYVNIEVVTNKNQSPLGDYITCYDHAHDTWAQQAMPRRLQSGEVIDRYIMSTHQARMINGSMSVFIESQVRLTNGQIIPIVLRAMPDNANNLIVSDWLRTEVFDADYYLTRYPTVRDACQGDRECAIDHWLGHGINEGRVGNYDFSVNYYLAKYPTIKRAVLDSNWRAIQHWLHHGIAEGRTGVPAP